jgi:hypothetical protein
MSTRPKVTKVKKDADKASRSEQQQPVKPVQTCPNKNWIELIYKYDSKRAVSGAKFQVFDANTNQSLACGTLNNMGFARVEGLPDGVTDVKFLFTSDPKPFEIYPGYKPGRHELTAQATEVKEEDGTAMSVLKWLGAGLAGDFIEDPSVGQIAFGTVVTLIPVVDQIGDVRDIVANLYWLTYKGKYKEWDKWFGLVVTLIGCFPEIGSVIKGAVKVIFKAVKEGASKLPIKKLMRFMNSVGEGNVVRFLREFLNKIDQHASEIAVKIGKLLEMLKSKVDDLKTFVFGKADDALEAMLNHIDAAYKLIPGMVRDVINKIAKHLKDTLDDVTDFVMDGVTRAKNGARQLKEGFLKAGRKVGLERAAKEAGMNPNDVERLVKHCKDRDRMVIMRFTNPESLKYHNMANHIPKPLDVKLKTAKKGDHAGLVMAPKEPMEDWERKNFKELTSPDLPKEKRYTVDNEGCLVDPNGNRIYGDHDIQSVHQKVEEPNGEKAYLQDQTNPHDSSTVGDMNEGGGQQLYQHGANDNYMVKTDWKGDVVKGPDGKPIPATVEDMNAGRATLGRQPGKDEKFLVIDEEGNMKVMDSPQELENFHKQNGLIWEYDPTPAIGPAGQAQLVMAGERTIENHVENHQDGK